jgi:hypothetical protein
MPEPIKVIIQKGQQAEGTVANNASVVGETKATEQAGKPNKTQESVNALLINIGKQAMVQGVKMSGDLTGNYAAVDMFSSMMSLGADALMIAVGGPVGAIMVGAKYAFQVANSAVSQFNAERENEMMIQRAGFIAQRGSRYSND